MSLTTLSLTSLGLINYAGKVEGAHTIAYVPVMHYLSLFVFFFPQFLIVFSCLRGLLRDYYHYILIKINKNEPYYDFQDHVIT